MTDLVVRLRNINADTDEMDRMLDEAADEIERLRAALEGIAKWSMNHDDATQRAKRAIEQCAVCGGSGFVMYDVEWEVYKTRCPRCGTAEQSAREN